MPSFEIRSQLGDLYLPSLLEAVAIYTFVVENDPSGELATKLREALEKHHKWIQDEILLQQKIRDRCAILLEEIRILGASEPGMLDNVFRQRLDKAQSDLISCDSEIKHMMAALHVLELGLAGKVELV